MQPRLFIAFFLLITSSLANSQCTSLGQNPSTAFPVCGTDTFHQTVVGICGTRNIPTNCSDGAGYQDKNPYWYKFTCFAAGTLGFTVTPINLNDDYDWQLFDITGRNPDEVYTNRSLTVSYNWSARPGATGTSNAGSGSTNCSGTSYPNFNAMPTLQKDHEYILLLSHFTNTQEGYSLSFGGGSANITDPKLPELLTAKAKCDGQILTIKLNKKMKCASLSGNGSEFNISPARTTVSGAVGYGCSTGFDTDSLTLSLVAPLPAGNYFVVAKNGGDGNTLLDNCNRNILPGNQVPLAVLPVVVTPMDSLSPIACAPNVLKLVFKKPMRCASVAANGSDFRVTGPAAVTVLSAAGNNCNSEGVSSSIWVTLSKPIELGGTYSINLQTGSDGNTIIDECRQETPAGASISFVTADTVSAAFTYTIIYGCKTDTVNYFHDGRNGVNSWRWMMDNRSAGTLATDQKVYTVFGPKTARLIVSNGVCTDTAFATINLDNELKAAFNSTDVICPNDTTAFTDASIGRVASWRWDFGNGNTSLLQRPPAQMYPLIETQRRYTIRLIVTNAAGCQDTITKNITAVANCYIAVPSAFTPNSDGLNDFLYPLNAYKADNLEFKVYNRYGQLVWQTNDWTRKWDGRIAGNLQTTQTFIWTLRYINRDSKQPFFLKGTSVLIR